MTTNIIQAIIRLVENPITNIMNHYSGSNRANNMGAALEKYIKDLFSGTLQESSEEIKLQRQAELFSYLGNQNNPPDIMIKNGDAIEVKKIESYRASLALNSSYPKDKLFKDNPMITDECKNCEDWTEKDMIYAVGTVTKNELKALTLVYGTDYAANANVYKQKVSIIKNGISAIDDFDFAETKELGRVNRVDPLGITNLRIRGMWQIDNPIKVFSYVYSLDESHKFNFMSIINLDKYNSFDKKDRDKLEMLSTTINELSISNIKIKNPNNPVKLKDAKLVTFFIK